ncbi:MAG: rubredoxin-like domain-containing protein, partial [Clostridiaceae bacterium]
NGLTYVTESVNALLSCKVISAQDCGSHTLFVADLTEARKLSKHPSDTYEYYRQHIKPAPGAKAAEPTKPGLKKWVCTVCGYIYEGESLPADYICPVCKHGAEVFVPLDESAAPAPGVKPAEPAKPAEPVKPAEPAKPAESKTKKWICTVCGYVYEGEELPPDYICPVCKHGAEVFVPLE